MSTPAADMAEKHARILGELAEFGLAFARKLHDQGMAAETAEETADLARAFHSVARSVRQTLALEARLMRDAQRQDREDRAEAEEQARREQEEAEELAQAPVEARKSRVARVLERIVWSEHEDEDEAEQLFGEVYDRLDADAQDPDFLDQAIDDQIARLCADFGLPPPERPAASARPGSPEAAAPPDREPPPTRTPPEPAYAADWADPP